MTVITADGLCMQMQEGDDSYPLYKKERDGLLSSLKRRAEMIEEVGSTTAELICCTVVYLVCQILTLFMSLLRYMANKYE